MLKIERDKLYKLRNGDIVRVLAVDVPGKRPVVVCNITVGAVGTRNADGSWHSNDRVQRGEHPADIEAEHIEPKVMWVNEYNGRHSYAYPNREEAVRNAPTGALYAPYRVAVRYVETPE